VNVIVVLFSALYINIIPAFFYFFSDTFVYNFRQSVWYVLYVLNMIYLCLECS